MVFKLDVINLIQSSKTFLTMIAAWSLFHIDGLRVHEYLKEISEGIPKYGSVTVGEMSSTTLNIVSNIKH
ncbi:hypothetical protein O9993_22165 [Vibrio lentus]|nr:hypothetical protein [Vibrio lentus]